MKIIKKTIAVGVFLSTFLFSIQSASAVDFFRVNEMNCTFSYALSFVDNKVLTNPTLLGLSSPRQCTIAMDFQLGGTTFTRSLSCIAGEELEGNSPDSCVARNILIPLPTGSEFVGIRTEQIITSEESDNGCLYSANSPSVRSRPVGAGEGIDITVSHRYSCNFDTGSNSFF